MDWLADEDNHYTLPAQDSLGVLSSTLPVIEQSAYVWINTDQVELLSAQWIREADKHTGSLWDNRYHFFDGTERSVNWLLLLDALNFCFWAEKGQPRWTIDYQGETLNGYWAEAAALKRAVEEGLPLWDAKYLSHITSDIIAHIFRGHGTIPLFEQRVAHAREVGRVLLECYDGQFTHAIEKAEKNAVKLALLLTQDFSSFYDVANYHTHPVKFFKRAQICVADLHGAFSGKAWGALTDIDQLTIFADYKLPQVLRHAKVLNYHQSLARRVDNQELLAAGSEEEIEIRAGTIWACELLRRAMLRHGITISAAEIDERLWLASQQSRLMQPYHHTRTFFY